MSLKNNETVQMAGYLLGSCVMCLVILWYLLNADISQAPVYIYSQF